jgi:alpha-galactosidase/6-phospho-beta-glucosidase family protein
VLELKAQLDALLREADQREGELQRQVLQMCSFSFPQFEEYANEAQKERDFLQSSLKDAQTRLSEFESREREESLKLVQKNEEKEKAMQKEIQEMQARLQQSQEDASQLAKTLETSQSVRFLSSVLIQQYTQRQLEQNRELVEMVRQLQAEYGIVRSEISLLETERKRLLDESLSFRQPA